MPMVEADVVANELERTHPKLQLLFEREATFYSKVILKRPAEEISSRDFRISLEIRPGGRFGHFNPDGGGLGRGDGPKFDKAIVPAAYVKMGVEWTRKSDWSTDTKKKAILSTFRHLVSVSMAEFRHYYEALCMTAGNGVLGTVTSVSTAANKDTLVMNTDGFDVRLLRYGQFVSVYASDLLTRRTHTLGSSLNGEAPIDLYDQSAFTIRVDGTTGATVAGDKVVVSGLTATPPVSVLGVAYHHSDASTGSWLGLDRATNPEVRANKVSGAAGFSLPMVRLMLNKTGVRLGKEQMKGVEIWTHPAQAAMYEEMGQLITSINTTTGAGKSLDLFYGDKMQMAGAPLETSFKWDKTRLDAIVKSNWGRTEVVPTGYYTDKQGRKFFEIRSSDGGVAAADIFYIVNGGNIYVLNPGLEGYIDGLPVPTGY